MKAYKEHLELEQNDDEGNTHKYYKEVNIKGLDDAKVKISKLIEEGLDNEILTNVNMKL